MSPARSSIVCLFFSLSSLHYSRTICEALFHLNDISSARVAINLNFRSLDGVQVTVRRSNKRRLLRRVSNENRNLEKKMHRRNSVKSSSAKKNGNLMIIFKILSKRVVVVEPVILASGASSPLLSFHSGRPHQRERERGVGPTKNEKEEKKRERKKAKKTDKKKMHGARHRRMTLLLNKEVTR